MLRWYMDDGPNSMDPLAVNFACQNFVNHGFFDIWSPIDVVVRKTHAVSNKYMSNRLRDTALVARWYIGPLPSCYVVWHLSNNRCKIQLNLPVQQQAPRDPRLVQEDVGEPVAEEKIRHPLAKQTGSVGGELKLQLHLQVLNFDGGLLVWSSNAAAAALSLLASGVGWRTDLGLSRGRGTVPLSGPGRGFIKFSGIWLQNISVIMNIGLWHFCLHVSSVSNTILWARANLRPHLQYNCILKQV